MLRISLFFFSLFLLASCRLNEKNPGQSKTQKDTEPATIDPEKAVHLRIETVGDYNQILDQLNKKDLKSIDLAIKVFQNSKTDSLSCDSMLVSFNDFFAEMTSTYLENNDTLQGRKGIDIADATTRKIKERLANYGIILTTAEGEFYLEPDNDFLIRNFGEKISPAYREYLSISASEQKQKFAEDGTLLIPADSLARRIVIWEDFMEKYPSFVSSAKAQDLYFQYIETYLSGTDNSKPFDSSSNKIREDLRKSIEVFIEQNPGRKSTALIKGYYELLKSSGFIYSEKIDSYILEKLYN